MNCSCSFHPTNPVLTSASALSLDHASQRSRDGEQYLDQLGRRGNLPEIPAHILHPEPALPPQAGGLGAGLQLGPEGEQTLLMFISCRLEPSL